MKHAISILTLTCSAILASWSTFASSPAATHDWVRMYVATNGVAVSTNAQGNASWSQGTGEDAVTVTVEMPTAFAMVCTNCDAFAAAQGLTNGATLVYHRPLAVFAAQNARVWVNVESNVFSYVTIAGSNSMTSTVFSASEWLATDGGTNRHARIATTYITPTRALAITNGLVFAEN